MSKKNSEARQRVRGIKEKARAARDLDAVTERRKRIRIRLAVSSVMTIILLAVLITIVVAHQANLESSMPPSVDTRVVLAHVAEEAPLATGLDSVLVGSPDAPVTLDVYEDFSCPHCGAFEAASGPLLDRIIATRQVRIAYHPLRIVSNYGTVAGTAAACVLAHDPADWPRIHSALFQDHSATTDSWTKKDMAKWLAAKGVDREETTSCTARGGFTGWIDANTRAAADDGVTGVPTLRVGEQTITFTTGQGLVDALMAAGAVLPDGIANP
ncbi:thioredoxin domain-containing protein [Clavibacter sp. VKM Ac-2873]|uniref:DsbA family protein n=1 Tax=Clavibacter sp. VKM Ac-2873 TaxID=2783813 RepID=UPI00188A5C56|nr:thioredoxin domain-containing protein [Clavibacter sp. VKM Ac-2873]MBF4619470.1 thioredoxin domain-containing protein [Clavibacter sp. VKM Ac-2873]